MGREAEKKGEIAERKTGKGCLYSWGMETLDPAMEDVSEKYKAGCLGWGIQTLLFSTLSTVLASKHQNL